MPLFRIPPIAVRLASLERALPKATLPQVRATLDELTELADKTGGASQTIFKQGLFEAAFDRMDRLNEREVRLNHRLCDVQRRLGELRITMGWMTAPQIEGTLDAAQQELFACEEPSTKALQKQLSALKRQWNQLYFEHLFPDTEELKRDSFQSNLWHRLSRSVKGMQLLTTLERQVHVAKEVFQGNFKAYGQLPAAVRREVELRLRENFPDFSLEHAEAANEEDRVIVAAAIMACVGERMMGGPTE